MEALKDPVDSVRAAVVETLGGYRREKTTILPKLMEALDDKSSDVRKAAILAMADIKVNPDKVKKKFDELASDTDPGIKLNLSIAKSLWDDVDPASIPILIEGLRTDHKKTSQLAQKSLRKLAKQKPDTMLPQLIDIIKTRDGFVLTNALTLLRFMKTAAKPALPDIIKLYDNKDPIVREDTLLTLSMVDPDGDQALPVLLKALKDPDHLVRREALYGLLVFRDKMTPHLGEVIALLSAKTDYNKTQVLDFLSTMKSKAKQAVPDVLKLTRHDKKRIRIKAVRTLGSIAEPTPDVLEALQIALKDSDTKVRSQASIALQRLEEKEPTKALPVIMSELKKEGSDKVEILRSLMELGPKAKFAIPELLKLADGGETVQVRIKAVQALGAAGSAEQDVLDALKKALEDKNLGVRKQAVIALERLGDPNEDKVATILIDALRAQQNPIIKRQISVSLKRLARDLPAPPFEKPSKQRRGAVH